jgi:hypothetical protein
VVNRAGVLRMRFLVIWSDDETSFPDEINNKKPYKLDVVHDTVYLHMNHQIDIDNINYSVRYAYRKRRDGKISWQQSFVVEMKFCFS